MKRAVTTWVRPGLTAVAVLALHTGAVWADGTITGSGIVIGDRRRNSHQRPRGRPLRCHHDPVRVEEDGHRGDGRPRPEERPRAPSRCQSAAGGGGVPRRRSGARRRYGGRSGLSAAGAARRRAPP